MPESRSEMSGKELVSISGVTDRSREGGMSEAEFVAGNVLWNGVLFDGHS